MLQTDRRSSSPPCPTKVTRAESVVTPTFLRVSPVLLVGCFLLAGCQGTFSDRVERSTSQVLSARDASVGERSRIAVIVYSDDGRTAPTRNVLDAAWNLMDRRVIDTDGFSSVSPELVRHSLLESGQSAADLHARHGRERFVTVLEQEKQRPDLLLLAKLSQQNQKTAPGFRKTTILLSLELVDATSGDRLAKENTWLSLEKYQ